MRDAKDQEYIQKMLKEYDRLSNRIYKEIQGWMDRYADNEGITPDEAYQQLSKDEQLTWTMTLKEFRQKAIEGGYDQELNREYFKSRITRLEQLERQLYFELAEAANNQEAAMRTYLKDTLNETYLRHIYEMTDRGAFSIAFDRFSTEALELAIMKPWKGSNFSRRVWGNHLNNIPDKLSKTMSVAISQGWGIDRTVKEMMQGVDSDLKNRMTTLVQTESAHIAEVANDHAMEQTGVEKWEWLATLEIHTCARCAGLDGQEFDADDETAPNCPDHPNCVLPENIVIAPDAEAMTRSYYSGDVVKITTANGGGLSVTPNHIMLTSSGWVRAKDLVKGDKIINYTSWREKAISFTGINPTNNDSVPTVEELFTTLIESGSVSSVSMPATPVDFKGDVIENSKIDIIDVNGFLRGKEDSSAAKFLSDFFFIGAAETTVGEGVFSSSRSFGEFLTATGLTADGIMSGNSVLDIFRFSPLTHHELVSLRLPSHYDARIFNTSRNNSSRNIETFRNGVDTFARDISRYNIISADLNSSSVGGNVVSLENSKDSCSPNTNSLSDFLDSFTGLIAFDDVVSLEFIQYSGHVYDISSLSTLYTVNGFLTSNCRCTRVPVIAGWKSSSRWQRDPITGKGKIGPNVTFEEWKQANVTPEVERSLKIERARPADKKQYEAYKSVIGKANMPKKFADFQDLKYNRRVEWNMLKDYKRSRKSNKISAFTSFGDFKSYKEKINTQIIGLTTSNGLVVRTQSKHFIERVFGTSQDPKTKLPRNGVEIPEIIEAIQKGAFRQSRTDSTVSEYQGKSCMVTINHKTGVLVQVSPRKLKKKGLKSI